MGVGLAGMPAVPLPYKFERFGVYTQSYGDASQYVLTVADRAAGEESYHVWTSEPFDAGTEEGVEMFMILERVVASMNRMRLAFEASEASNPGHGARDVFNYLWELENVTD